MPIQSTDTESTITFDINYEVWTIKAGVAVTVSGDGAEAVVIGHYGDLLDNFGTLSAETAVDVMSGATVAEIFNHAGAYIDGWQHGLTANSVGNFALHNAGEVEGGGTAVNLNFVYGDIENSGLIVSSDAGLEIDESSVGVDNTGTIQGAAAAVRILLRDGDQVSLHNAGLISGGPDGVAIYGWQDGKGTLDVTNEGRIAGGVELAATTVVASILNSGTILGDITFGDAADRYDGRTGSELGIIYGEGGNDLLLGGGGDDTLVGGLGRDRMDGGKGGAEDVFVFNDVKDSRTSAPDVISKHWSATDTIDLSAIDANVHTGGQQHLTFGGAVTAGAALTTGVVDYYQQGGDTFVVLDTSGDGAADFKLDIHGTVALNAGEFVL